MAFYFTMKTPFLFFLETAFDHAFHIEEPSSPLDSGNIQLRYPRQQQQQQQPQNPSYYRSSSNKTLGSGTSLQHHTVTTTTMAAPGSMVEVGSNGKLLLKKRRQTEPMPLSLPSVNGAEKLQVEGERDKGQQ